MLPHFLLPFTFRDGRAIPHYLTPRDAAWIRLLIDELDALVGRTHGDAARILADKTQQITSTFGAPLAAVRAVQHLLQRHWQADSRVRGANRAGDARAARVPSPRIRRVVFELGADPATPRDEVIRRAAEILGIPAEQVSEGLFADSASERRLSAPREEPSPHAIIDAHNVMLVQEFLLRSEQVVLRVGSHAAPVLRVAKQRGLMYALSLEPRGAVITLPGPISLFRRTLRYGRALTALLPALTTVPNWSLEARCVLGGRLARFEADELDPIVTEPPKDIDNPAERRLFDDFRRLGSAWSIAPATEPLRGKDFTLFPDFTFERGMDRVHVEMIGFHTPAFLEMKVTALRRAEVSSIIFCVDDGMACSDVGNINASEIFRFQKRVEVGKLLRAIERAAARRDAPPDSDRPSS